MLARTCMHIVYEVHIANDDNKNNKLKMWKKFPFSTLEKWHFIMTLLLNFAKNCKLIKSLKSISKLMIFSPTRMKTEPKWFDVEKWAFIDSDAKWYYVAEGKTSHRRRNREQSKSNIESRGRDRKRAIVT